MGKNLKDIVDEGFSQLDVLARKRMEILARAERISTASAGPQGADAELKMKASEAGFLLEMNSRVEQLLQELRQTLTQVADNNTSFQKGLRENLKMHVFGILAELAQNKSNALSGTSERLDGLLYGLGNEFESDKRLLGLESNKLIADLDIASKGNLASLRHTQADAAASVSTTEHEVNALLVKAFNQIIQGAETKRQEVATQIDNLYRRQVEKLEASAATLAMQSAPLIQEQRERMREVCANSEKELGQLHNSILDDAAGKLKAVSQAPLDTIKTAHESSKKETGEKLVALRELSAELLKREQESLGELNHSITSSADDFYATLTKFENVAGSARSPIDDAFAEIGVELGNQTEGLADKLKELLSAQSDGLSRLGTSTDKVFADLFADFKTQLNDLVNAQEQQCAEKEEQLSLQLQKLEEQINDTYALMKASGFSGKVEGNGNGSGGSAKE